MSSRIQIPQWPETPRPIDEPPARTSSIHVYGTKLDLQLAAGVGRCQRVLLELTECLDNAGDLIHIQHAQRIGLSRARQKNVPSGA